MSATRPFILDPLFKRLTTLPGVGPRTLPLLEKLCGGQKVLDMLWHVPHDFIDRTATPKIAEAGDGQIATIEVTVGKHFPNARKGQPYKVWCTDETGALNVVFFHAHKNWVEKQLPEGEKRVLSGRIEMYQGRPQMPHPDYIVKPEDRDEIEPYEPVYGLTAGVYQKTIRKAILGAFKILPHLPEWLDPAHKAKYGWGDWDEALRTVHYISDDHSNTPSHHPDAPSCYPGESRDLVSKELPDSCVRRNDTALERLAYDELLSNQLALAMVREKQKALGGRAFKGTNTLVKRLDEILPYKLTNAQQNTISEIYGDQAAPHRMLRLLQGDVGAGKTIVALYAMLRTVESGAQAAIMAPTEILARQHGASLKPFLDQLGVRFITLTGRDKGKARDLLLDQIASGAAQIVIGTHALFQESIEFANLGLAVIDEQHRFGVHQRLMLSSKGKGTDILVMTATPIPRTLALTGYGDMDISVLDEKPPGRKPIDTRLMSKDKVDAMIERLRAPLSEGARVYWVCPLVEDSDVLNLTSAEERYDVLKTVFGDRVGIVHGRMKPQEKDEVMTRFADGALSILVATTVIEVGVDVPEATIMVIEHAERFGLAQLHQLRGRVGRGGAHAFCFLIYATPLSATARERLKVMRETEDGFIIAARDLELRGTGDILGTRQSGEEGFRIADLAQHRDLLYTAQKDAQMILNNDPDLQSVRGQALRTLLYLFEQDQAIKYLRSG
jgi:ATP-dependent DNA helicase RecG